MINEYREIIESIDTIYVRGSYYYTEYIFNQLKKEYILKFIRQIMNMSGKTSSEAVIVLLAAMRFINKDIYELINLEKNDSFEKYIQDNYDSILDVSVRRKVQGNAPERGLPLLEIFGKKLSESSICVIELGASYGLIGNCLLNSKIMLDDKKKYFASDQKIPVNPKGIDYYIGIDIDPPDRDWLIACYSNPDDAMRLKNYLDDIRYENNFHILKSSAIGFTRLKEIENIATENFEIVVLTSFMFYQLEKDLQLQLKDEIGHFTKTQNRHWMCQEVELFNGQASPEYYVDWNHERLLKLNDDKCSSWKWINQ